MYRKLWKPLFDFLFAFVVFVILFPVFIFATFLLFIVNRGHPFFLQPRPGKNEKIFYIIKFKTMSDKTDIDGSLLGDDLRLTAIGRLIRRTSIDEIPQLLNVLKGEMSLIGPRPLLVEYIPLYDATQQRRHKVKPGITGWAQVNGRNAISWQEKFKLDVWYVDHLNLMLDIKILLLTLKKVFKREGISSNTSMTVERFKGN